MRTQLISITVSGVDQNGTAATSDMTSDAIAFKTNVVWSLNVWVNAAFAVTGQTPDVTVEVSNSTDADSFIPLAGFNRIRVPEYFDNLDSTWKYFRVIYRSLGATAGEKNFDLAQSI